MFMLTTRYSNAFLDAHGFDEMLPYPLVRKVACSFLPVMRAMGFLSLLQEDFAGRSEMVEGACILCRYDMDMRRRLFELRAECQKWSGQVRELRNDLIYSRCSRRDKILFVRQLWPKMAALEGLYMQIVRDFDVVSAGTMEPTPRYTEQYIEDWGALEIQCNSVGQYQAMVYPSVVRKWGLLFLLLEDFRARWLMAHGAAKLCELDFKKRERIVPLRDAFEQGWDTMCRVRDNLINMDCEFPLELMIEYVRSLEPKAAEMEARYRDLMRNFDVVLQV